MERDSTAARPRPGGLAAEAGAERSDPLAGAAAGGQAAGGPPAAWAPDEEAAGAAAVARLVAGAVGRAAGREEARLQAVEVRCSSSFVHLPDDKKGGHTGALLQAPSLKTRH